MIDVTPESLSAIAARAQRDYVTAPRVAIIGRVGLRTVARLHFPDGGDRIVSAGAYGEDYRDDHDSDEGIGYVPDARAMQLVAIYERQADHAQARRAGHA